MKKVLYLLILVTSIMKAVGQKSVDRSLHQIIPTANKDAFIDSLKHTVLSDTIYFNRKDLVNTFVGTRNKKQYSKLYLINGQYLFKLDIVPSNEVVDFANEFLEPKKVKQVTVIDTLHSSALYGINGVPGAIIITLKDGIKVNRTIAGLKMKSKKYGDNFEQGKDGQLLIRE